MLQIPKNIHYTKHHLWLQKIGRYDYYVGITDYGQKEIGTIDVIELIENTLKLNEGGQWGVVYGINETFKLVAPFDGQIVEKNANLSSQIPYINTDPYQYWIAILTTQSDAPALLDFDEYRKITQ